VERPAPVTVAAPEPPARAPRSNFRLGFFLAVLVFLALLLVYLMPERIIAAVPAAGGAVGDYVSAVDRMRLGLDRLAGDGVAWLGALSGDGAD
jgi:hypothetical protein